MLLDGLFEPLDEPTEQKDPLETSLVEHERIDPFPVQTCFEGDTLPPWTEGADTIADRKARYQDLKERSTFCYSHTMQS